MSADDASALRLIRQKIVDLRSRSIESDHVETVVIHIQNQVLAHDRQADQSNVTLWLHVSITGRNVAHEASIVDVSPLSKKHSIAESAMLGSTSRMNAREVALETTGGLFAKRCGGSDCLMIGSFDHVR